MIILSARHRGLRRLIENNDSRGIGTELAGRVRNILAVLVLAEDIPDFLASAPPGWRVHQLGGGRKDTWSVSVSGNWRLTFDEQDGRLSRLDLEDYH